MQLELIEKLAEENLAELHVARLQTPQGPVLVTARRLNRLVADSQSLMAELQQASARAVGLRHAHLLAHIGMFRGGSSTWWLSERTEGFDLGTAFNRLSSREVRITPLRALQIGVDLLSGLEALHQSGQAHGGLDPRYVVVDLSGMGRLDGAGLEHVLMSARDLRQKARRGRKEYLAPEAMGGRKPDLTGDVFAAAAVIYHLLTGQPALGGEKAGMSTRHKAVQPPSKIDRSLPYACDAVFIKALSTSPSQRQSDGKALGNAVNRLRMSLLTGADEGRAGVADFISNLYPNEAKVAGMSGTLQRPSKAEAIALTPIGAVAIPQAATPGAAAAPAALVPSAVTEDLPAVDHGYDPDDEPEVVTEVGRPSGTPGIGIPDKAEPITQPGNFPAVAGSAVVGMPKTAEPLDANDPGFPDTAEPLHAPASPSLAAVEWQGEATPALEPGSARPPDLSGVESSAGAGDTAVMPMPVDGAAEGIQPPALPAAGFAAGGEGVPPWKKPAFLLTAGLVGFTLVVLVLLLGGLFSSEPELGPAGPPSGQSSLIGYLSIDTDKPARVELDGEILPGKTPLLRKIIRAGSHRLVVKDSASRVLLKETILVPAGEHKEIRLIGAGAAHAPKIDVAPEQPQLTVDPVPPSSIEKAPGPKKVSKKKVVRKKKRKTGRVKRQKAKRRRIR